MVVEEHCPHAQGESSLKRSPALVHGLGHELHWFDLGCFSAEILTTADQVSADVHHMQR